MTFVIELVATSKYRFLLQRNRDYETAKDPFADPEDLRDVWARHTTRPSWMDSHNNVLLRRHRRCPPNVLNEILDSDPSAARDIAANPATEASTLIAVMRHADPVVSVNAQTNPALPSEVLDALANPAGGEWPHLLGNSGCPSKVLAAAAASADPNIRALAATNIALAAADREALVSDPDPEVRRNLAWNRSLSVEHIERLSETPDPDTFLNLLRNPSTPPLVLQRCMEYLLRPAYPSSAAPLQHADRAHASESTAA